jgi:D-amino-acid oxidase
MAATAATDVVVIGAGVSGLTTAISLAEVGLRVRVLAEKPPARTTSALAGASWGPYLASEPRVVDWSEATRKELELIAAQDASGVHLVPGMEAAPDPVEPPVWARGVPGFRMCETHELPSGYSTGWRYVIPLVDMPVYLSYLERRLAERGCAVEHATVNDFTEVAGLAPVIVNCTGLAARDLVPDPEVSPTRGQLVVVRNPGVDYFFQDQVDGPDLTYFLPHGDHVVLGGKAVPGGGSTEPDPAVAVEIIERCVRIEPKLRGAEVIGHRVGWRPTRPEVRVGRDGAIVHNYGHGGSGVTLSWGCAREVVDLVTNP